VQAGDHVVLAVEAEHTERLGDDLLVDLVGEVHREVAAVDLPLSGARGDSDAGDGLLAATSAATVALNRLAVRSRWRLGGHGLSHGCSFLRRYCATWLMTYGTGCCAACGCSDPAYTFSFVICLRPSLLCGKHAGHGLLDHAARVLLPQIPVVVDFSPPG
jgi:hypothetical protein